MLIAMYYIYRKNSKLDSFDEVDERHTDRQSPWKQTENELNRSNRKSPNTSMYGVSYSTDTIE